VAGADSTAAVYSVILLAIFENREVEEKLRKTIEIHFKTEEDFNY
jgi:cytochrome P450